MTRINAGVHPAELPDKLLLAEHREITRIPNAVRRLNPSLDNLPETFRLGPGHVRFFYDKLWYLELRYEVLYQECISRGFNVTDKLTAFNDTPVPSRGKYRPTPEARQLIVDRIRTRGFELLSPDWGPLYNNL